MQEASAKKKLSPREKTVSQTLEEISDAIFLLGITIATDKKIGLSKIFFLLSNAGGS